MAHRLQQLGRRAQSSRPPGSGAQALSCGAGAQVLCACGILPDQEADPCLQLGQAGSLPLSHQEALAGVSLRRVPGEPAGFSSPAQLPGCAVDQGLTAGLQ